MPSTIRIKLSTIAAIPLLFALALVVHLVLTAHDTHSHTSDLDGLVRFVRHASAYMHETQKERGITAVFTGEGGKLFRERVDEQRRVTDTARATLRDYLVTYDPCVHGEAFSRKVEKLTSGMKLLDDHRTKVDRVIPAEEAIEFYTKHNSDILRIVTAMTRLNDDAEFAIIVAAYENFLQGKERAGLERAVLSSAFAAERFEPGIRQKFESLVVTQDTYFRSFLEFATEEQAELYSQTLSKPVINEVERLRDIAFRRVEATPANLSTEAQFNLAMVWQWLTDISVTRARDGLDDGFDEAEKHAKAFRQNVAGLSAMVPGEEEMFNDLLKSFEAFYEKGKWMAQRYIEDGTEEGNKAMGEFDAFAEDIVKRLEVNKKVMAKHAGFAVDAGKGFDAMTERINLMNEVENKLTLDLHDGVSAIRKSARMSFTLLSVAMSIVTALVVSVIFAVGNRIIRPVEQLTDAVKLVAHGDLDQRIESTTTDEIGELADSFNSMVACLHEAEKEIRQSETKFRALYDSTSDAVMLLDENGFFDCNEATVQMFGCKDKAEFCSKHPGDLSPPEQPCGTDSTVLANQRIATAMEKGSNLFEWTHMRVDSCKEFPAEVMVDALELDGRPALQAVVRDITERKRVQQEIEDYARVVESNNAALEELNQIAEGANRAKSEFLANMSHEIRTPMTAILGFSDILMGSELNQEQLDAVATIGRNGQYLIGLINDILDLSKIEAGKLNVEHIQCSPSQILSEVVSLVNVRARAKNLPLEIEYDGPIPESIHSDPTRLRQILINLAGNAVKFTETGKVRVIARLLDVKSDQPKMQFDIVDSGIGMTDLQVEGLFKPFHQADTSTTRKFGGTGLGLTISRRLAYKLDGDITVKSELGTGSTFTVTIGTGPLDGVDLIDNPRQSEVSSDAKKQEDMPVSGLDCRILLAEDGPDNQRLISFVLKKAGADVVIVDNGKAAHDAALMARDEGTPFDVILLDMQMPIMDGYDATAKLRKAEYAGPIIALTAHAMSTDRDKCLEAGCNDYSTKPIDRVELLSLIAQYASSGGPVADALSK